MIEEIIKVDGKDYKIDYEGEEYLTDMQRLSVVRKISSQQKNVVNVSYPKLSAKADHLYPKLSARDQSSLLHSSLKADHLYLEQVKVQQQVGQQQQIKSLSPGAHPSIPVGRTTGYVDKLFNPNDTIIMCLFENKASLGYTQGMAKFQGSRHNISENMCYQDIPNATIDCTDTTAYNLKGLARAHVKGQGIFDFGCLETFGCSSGDNCTAGTCTTWGSRISFETTIPIVTYIGSTPIAPTTLTVTPGNGQLSASWSFVTDPNVGGEVFAYRVTIYEAGWPVADGYVEKGVHTATIGGLNNGTTYNVSVAGVSHDGTEGWDKTTPGTPVGATVPTVYNVCWKVGLSTTGSCAMPPDQPPITQGTAFIIKADIANTGPSGKVRAVFKDGTTVITGGDQQNTNLGTFPGGGLWSPYVNFTMPNRNVTLNVEAYGWDGTNWVLTQTRTLTISMSAPVCTNITLTPFSATVSAGGTVNFTATVTPSTTQFTANFKLRDGTLLASRTTSGGIATFVWTAPSIAGSYYVHAEVGTPVQCASTESTIQVSPPIIQHNINITVKDIVTNNPIQGASVTIGTQTLLTNVSGFVTFRVNEGTITVSITKAGYNPYSTTELVYSDINRIYFLATITPTTGSLNFITVPTAADIYFGATFKGTTNATTGVLLIPDLPTGPVNYTVKKTGYNDASGTVTVIGGVTTNVPVSLAPSTPTTGDVCIKSIPSGASITIDNTPQIGKTSALSTGGCDSTSTITGLAPGSHTYKLTLVGYQDKTGTFNITAGSTTVYDVGALTALTTVGTLDITSNPTGARIFIDNIDSGYATRAVIQNISQGGHTYKLNLSGYQDKTGAFNITAGQTTTIDAGDLTPSVVQAGFGTAGMVLIAGLIVGAIYMTTQKPPIPPP